MYKPQNINFDRKNDDHEKNTIYIRLKFFELLDNYMGASPPKPSHLLSSPTSSARPSNPFQQKGTVG